jgi:hypothetical protein
MPILSHEQRRDGGDLDGNEKTEQDFDPSTQEHRSVVGDVEPLEEARGKYRDPD